MVFALPESRSSIRRAISSFHAASAASSTVASRLSMSEPASSARSSSESERAFCSNSEACCVMGLLYTSVTGDRSRGSVGDSGHRKWFFQLGRVREGAVVRNDPIARTRDTSGMDAGSRLFEIGFAFREILPTTAIYALYYCKLLAVLTMKKSQEG